MDIFRLIISILFPPIGLFVNYMLGCENKLQRISMAISIVLSFSVILFIVFIFILAGTNNQRENDLLKCRNPYYCEPSEGEYQTCYYCKDKVCNDLGKIQCLNDTESQFNYQTVADPNDE